MLKELKWFTKTSKNYMGYGENTSKFKFWLKYPIALTKYTYYSIKG